MHRGLADELGEAAAKAERDIATSWASEATVQPRGRVAVNK